jgi:hypothetical protein
MKTTWFLLLFISLLVIAEIGSSFKFSGSLVTSNKGRAKKKIGENNGNGFAVLELFTSEGCSSCPPADELLAKIHRETEGEPVYILVYHVDYWNRLGWKDIFSSAEFSERQVQYGHWLNVSPIYTPQVIVNGKTQFVGSEESAIRHAISEQLIAKPVSKLTIQAVPEGGQLNVKYQSVHAVNGCIVLIAIIQKAAQTNVERGENAGRLLSHVQIVRKLESRQLSVTGEGNTAIALPKGFDAKKWEVLALIQNQNNGEILAVAKADL